MDTEYRSLVSKRLPEKRITNDQRVSIYFWDTVYIRKKNTLHGHQSISRVRIELYHMKRKYRKDLLKFPKSLHNSVSLS